MKYGTVHSSGKEIMHKGRKCYCGHWEKEHTTYVNDGKNAKGSRFVCTKDNCSRWNQCDLRGEGVK